VQAETGSGKVVKGNVHLRRLANRIASEEGQGVWGHGKRWE